MRKFLLLVALLSALPIVASAQAPGQSVYGWKLGTCYNSTINNWVPIANTTANQTNFPLNCDQQGNIFPPTPSSQFPTVTACNVNGRLYLGTVNGSLCYGSAGADMGAQINAALASSACTSGCTIDATPLTGNQVAAENVVINKINTTLLLNRGVLAFTGSNNLQITANGSQVIGTGFNQSQITCVSAVSCVVLGGPSTTIFNPRIKNLAVAPGNSSTATCGISIENARQGEISQSALTGFASGDGLCVYENSWTWNLSYNQMTSNLHGIAFYGDAANAWKFEHNLVNSNTDGFYFALATVNGGFGTSGGMSIDNGNHCEGNTDACFRFVDGQFYAMEISGQYNELTAANSRWIYAKSDNTAGHQLFINGINVNGAGGFFNGGVPIVDADSTGAFAGTTSSVTSFSRDGVGTLTVTTSGAHGLTCTTPTFCPFVTLTSVSGSFNQARIQIKAIVDSTHFTVALGGGVTTDTNGGTAAYAPDQVFVNLDSMIWRTSSSAVVAVKATGSTVTAKVGSIRLTDAGGTLTTETSASTSSAVSGGTILSPVQGNTSTSLIVPGPVQTICNQTAFVTNTGNTTTNVIGSCDIPKGMMGPTSRLLVRLWGAACKSSGVPFAGCAAINTGTCGSKVAWNNAATNAGTGLLNQNMAAAGHWEALLNIGNITATSQQTDYVAFSTGITQSTPAIASLNTAAGATTDTFVVFVMTNSVSGDVCGEHWTVELWP